jgi:hypothetical protein
MAVGDAGKGRHMFALVMAMLTPVLLGLLLLATDVIDRQAPRVVARFARVDHGHARRRSGRR